MQKKITASIYFNILFCLTSYCQTFDWSITSCPAATSRFDDMSFVNEQLGFVIDFNGGLYKTFDGGQNWLPIVGPPSNVYRSVHFIDSLRGFIGVLGSSNVDSTIIYQTIDGGNNWSTIPNFPIPTGSIAERGGICGMCSVEDSVVYACGRFWGPSYVYKSTNSGLNWQRIDMSSLAYGLVDIYFWSKDSGIVVGSTDTSLNSIYSNAAIFRTVDGGANWSIVYQSQMQGETCWKISVPQTGYFFVSVEQYNVGPRYILKSTDYGNNWNEMQYSYCQAGNVIANQGIGFRTINEGWVGINANASVVNSVFHTTDGGLTWLSDTIEWGLNRLRFLNDSVGFASGLHVFKLTKNSIVSTTENISKNSFQVYPTLSNGIINVKFETEEKKLIKVLSVDGKYFDNFNLVGKEIQLDLSSYPSGAYYLLVQSQENYTSELFFIGK